VIIAVVSFIAEAAYRGLTGRKIRLDLHQSR
jgi:hypothetical protein